MRAKVSLTHLHSGPLCLATATKTTFLMIKMMQQIIIQMKSLKNPRILNFPLILHSNLIHLRLHKEIWIVIKIIHIIFREKTQTKTLIVSITHQGLQRLGKTHRLKSTHNLEFLLNSAIFKAWKMHALIQSHLIERIKKIYSHATLWTFMITLILKTLQVLKIVMQVKINFKAQVDLLQITWIVQNSFFRNNFFHKINITNKTIRIKKTRVILS